MEKEKELSRRDMMRLGVAGTGVAVSSGRSAKPGPWLEYGGENIVYENPKPNLYSRHAYFPGLLQLSSGDLLALFVIAEAFSAANGTTYISRSSDLGSTWQLQGRLYDKSVVGIPTNDSMKATQLQDGTLVAIGYRFHRLDPDRPASIEETGGMVPGDDLVAFSRDEGRTWSIPQVIPRQRPELYEISGPCIQLRNGHLLAAGGFMPLPDGTFPSGNGGVVLRSKDGGKTWDDGVRFFPKGHVTAWETRLCAMEEGRVVAILWAYDVKTKKHLPNHVVVSHDDGRTWGEPINTGIMGQASNLYWLEGNLLLSIHAHRAENPGLFVRLVDFTDDKWKLLKENAIWGAGVGRQTRQGQSMYRMFSSLRFGQPALLRLRTGALVATHWSVENCQGRIKLHRLHLHI
jgi:sialidase-1